MKSIKTKHIPNTALLFIILAPASILFYATYIFNIANAGNIYLYILQVFADSIAIVILGTLWLTILLDLIQPEYHKRQFKYDSNYLANNKPKVDILIPVSHEPFEIIEKTVKAAAAIEYPHTLYILDDASNPLVKNLAKELKASYINRSKEQKTFAKSGNLNHGLSFCKGEFFAVFDADHIPEKNFFHELLPFFENKKVALVQTPQYYTNTHNFIAQGTSQAQEVFYKYVQPAKNSYNASFCVGTNMIYRRSAIDEIGGIALRDHSEDIWTTILLHERGYESIYYNKILAFGRAPESITSFFRQQNRWAQGGFSLFFSHNPLFIPGLTTDQKLQYFFSNIHYFSAFSIIVYLAIPILYLLFGIHSMDVLHDRGWLIHYIPYFITVYFLPLYLLGNLKMATISTSIASFAPYMHAFFLTVFKNKYKWVATESQKKFHSPIMLHIWPHVFIIIVSLLAILVGWYNPVDVTTTLITTFWVLLNSYFMFVFVRAGLFNQ